MAKQSKAARLIQQLQDWSEAELEELAEMIAGLRSARAEVAAEEPEAREDGSALGKHGGRGHIELKMIPDAKTGKTYGPYRYLRYWGVTKQGKMGLKSVYLGKGGG
jgi:diadenosine tetraphosphate (Ap4A) HIT family hydrolase